jgi:hypothetical protein
VTESQERRRYRRLKSPKHLLVVWKLGSQKYVSKVENMGLGGLFIRTANPPKAGTTLQLLFNSPEGEVRGLAAVRNCSPGEGMRVAIVSMDPEHRTRLDRWLRKLSAQVESSIAPA